MWILRISGMLVCVSSNWFRFTNQTVIHKSFRCVKRHQFRGLGCPCLAPFVRIWPVVSARKKSVLLCVCNISHSCKWLIIKKFKAGSSVPPSPKKRLSGLPSFSWLFVCCCCLVRVLFVPASVNAEQRANKGRRRVEGNKKKVGRFPRRVIPFAKRPFQKSNTCVFYATVHHLMEMKAKWLGGLNWCESLAPESQRTSFTLCRLTK